MYFSSDLLYVIEYVGCAVIKVGRSQSPMQRLDNFQQHHFAELTIIGVSSAGHSERKVLKRLSKFRLRGEWFRFNDETKSCLNEACNELSIRLRPYADVYAETKLLQEFSNRLPKTFPSAAIERLRSAVCLIEHCGQSVQKNGLCSNHLTQYKTQLSNCIPDDRVLFELAAIENGLVAPDVNIKTLLAAESNPFDELLAAEPV